jgi:3-oxoacyl-[acyl-carrier-protein] synthase III
VSLPRARIAGAGSFLPERVVSNDELARTVDTSDAWIRERTGIGQRHLATGGETTTSMAERAARAALDRAGVHPSQIGLTVLATATADNVFPASAVAVQAALGAGGHAYDIAAACSGFIFALAAADNAIRVGQVEHALVIGSEVFSRLLNWQDRATCVLFGDGAGAVVLSRGAPDGPGILSTHLHSDGTLGRLLYVEGGAGQPETSNHVVMQGREVFRHAVVKLAAVVDEALDAHGLGHSDVDWLVPHQANRRIIDAMGRKLGLPPERVVVTVERHANTSAASIPLALAEAMGDGRIRPGELVVMEALGGGMTWGSALVRM